MTAEFVPEIDVQKIQEKVVGMYSEHPWPLDRRTEEEMGWRLKCLGVLPTEYQGKRVLEMGCGTGNYALWYAANGASEVVGIDLSDGSLAAANKAKEEGGLNNIDFRKMDILKCDLPDNYFDFSYSVGVLHHTGDPLRGFKHLVRVTKPGGTIIVSLYNHHSCRKLRAQQAVCRWLGGDDLDKRVEWGKKLFPGIMRRMDQRYHGLNTEQLAYDMIAFPHASFHTGRGVLSWFDQTGVTYKGSFAPLSFRDYLYAFSRPEYEAFRATFDGFPGLKFVANRMSSLAKKVHRNQEPVDSFPRPNQLSAWAIQNLWMIFGLRFHHFTVAGTKKA
jgi:ubiquinone/menaquinone biosynthesis C-methylase UbiE